MKPRKPLSAAGKAFKKVKAGSISTLKKKVWKTFSLYIRTRDNWTCFTCGKVYDGTGSSRGGLQAGHFISRRINATLYDEVNVHAQCYFCNVMERGNVGEYSARLIEKYGEPAFKALLARGRQMKQWTPKELTDLLTKYQSP